MGTQDQQIVAVTRSQATINDKPLTFETGKYARQAGGAVTVRYGVRRRQDPRLVPAA